MPFSSSTPLQTFLLIALPTLLFAHPTCLRGELPFAQPLEDPPEWCFPEEYGNYTDGACCSSTSEGPLKATWESWIDADEHPKCAGLLKEWLCASCHPEAEHLFQQGEPRIENIIFCLSSCPEAYEACVGVRRLDTGRDVINSIEFPTGADYCQSPRALVQDGANCLYLSRDLPDSAFNLAPTSLVMIMSLALILALTTTA